MGSEAHHGVETELIYHLNKNFCASTDHDVPVPEIQELKFICINGRLLFG